MSSENNSGQGRSEFHKYFKYLDIHISNTLNREKHINYGGQDMLEIIPTQIISTSEHLLLQAVKIKLLFP